MPPSRDPTALLNLLKSHLKLDGGVTFATTLGEYVDLKLGLSSRKTKLLNFLEDHNSTFSTSRTNPHIVSILEVDGSGEDVFSPTIVHKPGLEKASKLLLEKILLILESDHRRRLRRASTSNRPPNHVPTLMGKSLVKKLGFELHHFLHFSSFYTSDITAVEIFTPSWFAASVPFVAELLSSSSTDLERLFEVSDGPSVSLLGSYTVRDAPPSNVPEMKVGVHLKADSEGAFSVTNAKGE